MNQIDFTQAAKQVQPQLYSHALHFTRDEDDAKDLLQETLIKGIRFCHRFDNGTNLKGWLYVIMKNTFYNSVIKSKRRSEVISDEDLESPNLILSSTKNASEGKFAIEDINKALEALRPGHRIAFQRYFEGYKYEEIAGELNIPLGTVKTYIFQARSELKKYLKMYR
ncbi:RNA polymerase sigma factor [Pedobacter fastidiosus]|uniref:Sigma-70 family RNA polymerase sigma factor n=1 Tax=Pedobacter fastidiosus TaxID=2765361 RepID=A0ABR7KXI6_9SPHI|nr:sigma-70 family RNA polymerase sigma factor [Pedobacter fastidiosus]MBC6112735.1 sigma-70 family RNA polymerase sigma factor [Pedobacter fastidiosus]